MKKALVLFLSLVLLAGTACSAQQPEAVATTAPTTVPTVTTTPEEKPIEEPEEEMTPEEAAYAALEEETYQLLLAMDDPAKEALFWYFSDSMEGSLQIETEGTYADDDSYRKVGRFATINEMKAATEQLFTKDFCEAHFYRAFSQPEERPMYKEVDGQLYRNINGGGMGWPWALTDVFQLAYADDQWRVLGMRLEAWGEFETWENFVFQYEDGGWKLNHFYGFNPYSNYADMAKPLLDSSLSVFNWDNISDVNSFYLNDFYIYQFIAVPGTDGYPYAPPKGYEGGDAGPGYPVPMDEAVANMISLFDNADPEVLRAMLIEAGQHEYSSMTYEEATDSLTFIITFDPASPVVVDVVEDGDKVVLQSLIIAKNGKAAYWGYLTAKKTDDGLQYISNRVVDIPYED